MARYEVVRYQAIAAFGFTWILFTVVGGAASATGDESLSKARRELAIAVERAEQSLAAHQPGSGHTKQHMQQVLNVLEGENGTYFNGKVGNPGDGVGVMQYMEKAERAAQQTAVSPDVRQAIHHSKTFTEEAARHARRSVEGTSVEETHRHAALAAGLLQAALGRERSRSPVTGTLTYALAKETS